MKITIFGGPGTGTSTVGKLLAERLEHPFMSTGNIFRGFAKEAGYTVYEFEDKVAKHDNSFDIKLDLKSKEYGENNLDFVFESRLAWYFIADSYKICLTCEDTERYRGIHEREGGNLDELVFKNKKREDEVATRYAEIYPEIHYPPKIEVFDLVVDATNMSPEEIIEEIYKKIIET